ncbi:MAG: hypothetical protein K9N29_11130 [Candidatus Marinimicrobia bacterium]|nr:hypothetical protein [Candidatus Neomarinimicrobiota bacterium]
MGINMAKMQDMEQETNLGSGLTKTFINVKPNALPDPIRNRVISYVIVNHCEEEILRRVPGSVAEAFLGDFLKATGQEITRVKGPNSDTVILRHKIK